MKTFLIGGARSGKSSLAAHWAAQRSQRVCCVVTATASDNEMAARIDAHRRERPPHWRTREEPLRLGAALRDEGATGDLLLVDCLTLWTANCLWPPSLWASELQESKIGHGTDTLEAKASSRQPASADPQADLTGRHPALGEPQANPAGRQPAPGGPQANLTDRQPTLGGPQANLTSRQPASADPLADLAGWHQERDAFLETLRTATAEIIIVSNEVGTSLVPENAAARLFRDEQGRLNQLVAAACDEAFLVTAGLALRLK